MSRENLQRLEQREGVARWRVQTAHFVESKPVQTLVVAVILLNAAILGMETDAGIMAAHGTLLQAADKACLAFFVLELGLKMSAYRGLFWRNGWNWFDFIVVGIALAPGTGPWAVLRSLRVLRVLRLLTVVPQMRRVVAAFLHSIPGLEHIPLNRTHKAVQYWTDPVQDWDEILQF